MEEEDTGMTLIKNDNTLLKSDVRQFALQCCTDFVANKRGCMSRRRKETHRQRSTRATVSIAPDTYSIIQAIAKQKKVSAAWVIRDAVDKYVAEELPLLQRTG